MHGLLKRRGAIFTNGIVSFSTKEPKPKRKFFVMLRMLWAVEEKEKKITFQCVRIASGRNARKYLEFARVNSACLCVWPWNARDPWESTSRPDSLRPTGTICLCVVGWLEKRRRGRSLEIRSIDRLQDPIGLHGLSLTLIFCGVICTADPLASSGLNAVFYIRIKRRTGNETEHADVAWDSLPVTLSTRWSGR